MSRISVCLKTKWKYRFSGGISSARGSQPRYGEKAGGSESDETDAYGPAESGARQAATISDLKAQIDRKYADADAYQSLEKAECGFHSASC
jgi:hypothetical protein